MKAIIGWLLAVGLLLIGLLATPVGVHAQQTGIAVPEQLVKLHLIVADSSNRSLDDIKQEDIQVVADGKAQKIAMFMRDEGPVKYGVAIDTSGSFRRVLESTLNALKLLAESNRVNDETMVVRFGAADDIQTLQTFTSDKSKILGIPLNQFNPRPGQTAVIDAVYHSVKAITGHKPGDPNVRRALVLISDGEDRKSSYSKKDLLKLLRETTVQIFIIGVVSELDNEGSMIRKSNRQRAEELLNEIAVESGGRVFSPGNRDQLMDAAKQIVHDLQAQYLVGFVPEVQPGDQGFRKIKVEKSPASSHKKLSIITRPGYWLETPAPAPSSTPKDVQ